MGKHDKTNITWVYTPYSLNRFFSSFTRLLKNDDHTRLIDGVFFGKTTHPLSLQASRKRLIVQGPLFQREQAFNENNAFDYSEEASSISWEKTIELFRDKLS